MNYLGDNMLLMVTHSGRNQEDIAKIFGISRPMITVYIRGNSISGGGKPILRHVQTIITMFGIDSMYQSLLEIEPIMISEKVNKALRDIADGLPAPNTLWQKSYSSIDTAYNHMENE